MIWILISWAISAFVLIVLSVKLEDSDSKIILRVLISSILVFIMTFLVVEATKCVVVEQLKKDHKIECVYDRHTGEKSTVINDTTLTSLYEYLDIN